MRHLIAIAVIVIALPGAKAEPLDRIAVSIGTEVITESAVILDLRVGAFMDRREVDLSAAAKRKSAERLTDQVLILREATSSKLQLPTTENAVAVLGQVKKLYSGEAEYQAELRRQGVTEDDVVKQLLAGLIMFRFSDVMFKPTVLITEVEMRAYYERVKESASFDDARDDIEALLTDQRADEALDVWLKMAREGANVQFREKVFQ
jgi:peptidyl-prolyl cis-trans isomerase SurA